MESRNCRCYRRGRASTWLEQARVFVLAAGLPFAQVPVASDATAEDDATAHFRWSPELPLDEASAPRVVAFRDGYALRFSAAGRTLLDLGRLAGARGLRLRGPCTLRLAVRLADVPRAKIPFLSKWHMKPRGRAIELGVLPDGRPFFDVSASGHWPERARELVGGCRLERDTPYAIAAVFDPGRRLEIFVNGVSCGKATQRVPERMFPCDTPVLLGAQPPGRRHFDGLIGGVWIDFTAWTESEVSGWAGELGLTAAPTKVPSAVLDDAMDLSVVRPEILRYVEALRVAGRPYGVYRNADRPNAKATLYATTDVAWIRACMGEDLERTLTEAQRREWIDHINSFARDDGAYPGGRHSLLHANGMVIGALSALGGRQKYPVRLYDAFDGLDEIEPWLEDIRWERQWSASHLFWGGMHCFSLSRRCSPAWRERVFDWLDANLDETTGWWRKGVPQSGAEIEVLGGAAHIWPMYQHHGRRFPRPRRVIDSILAMQKPDGSWIGFANYMELDALYGLAYMKSLAEGYREEDIARAVRAHGRLALERYPGFLAGRPDAHTVLAQVGTLGLLQKLAPESFRDSVTWSDIFSDLRFYRTAAVEVFEENIDGDGAFAERSIIDLLRRVNRYQLAHPWKETDRNWIRAAWYTGIMAAYRATGEREFLEQALRWARKHRFLPGDEPSGANVLTCGQTYLELYFVKKDPAMIRPLVDWISSGHPKTPTGGEVWYREGGLRYADSLYVAPPALAMLARATGDPSYLDFMDAMFWDVHRELFDDQAGLFYRDRRFLPSRKDEAQGEPCPESLEEIRERRRSWVHTRTINGKKVLWSRGNGWAIAGVVRILEYLPREHPSRARYAVLLRTMAASLARRQGDDGLWRVNLADPDEYPAPESSGTGFFCYAMAWGVRNGVLDRETYEPVVRRAWKGLVSCISPEGKVGWGQPVAAGPYRVLREDSHEYVTGTFLLAGSEVLKLIRGG